jgi:hypothetical protein
LVVAPKPKELFTRKAELMIRDEDLTAEKAKEQFQ